MKSVIGIDPGSSQSAYVLWDNKKILEKGIHPNEELIEILADQYCDVASRADDIVLAIESMVHIHVPKNGQLKGAGKEIVDTIFWTGRFYESWTGKRERVPRHVVKKALGAKDDPGVRAALIARFGEQGTKKHPGMIYGLATHLWAAFAVAVVWLDHLEFQGRELK